MRFNHTSRRVLADPLYGSQPVAGIRAAENAAQRAAGTAAATGAQYGAEAQTIGGMLTPELQADITNPQGFSQAQQNAMLVQGMEGAGGAASGIAGQAGLQAARSRNVGGSAGVLDENAREKMRTSAGVGLDVATKNAMLQQQQREQALKQMQGLYGTQVEAGLKAQGLVPEDINAWANASKTGWVQNVDQTISAVLGSGGMSSMLKPSQIPCWIAAAVFHEDLRTGLKTNIVREWLWNVWSRNWYAKPILAAYSRYGEWLARQPILVWALRPLFFAALRRATG